MADEWDKYAVEDEDEWEQYAVSEKPTNQSVMTEGPNYIKEHPFKTAFQPASKTLTGMSASEFIDRNIGGAGGYQRSLNLHGNDLGGRAMAFLDTYGKGLGGDITDLYQTPATHAMGPLLGPVASRLAKTRAGHAVGEFLNKDVGKSVDNFLHPPPEVLVNKAQKLTTELLQPGKSELTSYLSRGKQLPAVDEATKVIHKSKDYVELRTNLENSIKRTMEERNNILKANNFKIQDHTKELNDFIKQAEKQGQYTESEIKAMKDVFLREKEFIAKNRLDRLSGQARKEELQKMTESLLKKKENGEIIDRDPARNLALDQLRMGLMKAVEGGDIEVRALNSTYGGLLRARELAAGQEALAGKAIPENVLQKVFHLISKPGDIPSAVAQGALAREGSLLNKTKKIQDLMNKARASRVDSFFPEVLRDFPVNKGPFLSGPTPQKLLPSPKTKALPSPKDVPYNPTGKPKMVREGTINPPDRGVGRDVIRGRRPDMSYEDNKKWWAAFRKKNNI